MPWEKESSPVTFNPFTELLLLDRRTLFSINNSSEAPELAWPSLEADAKIVAQLLEIIWTTRSVSDQEFLSSYHPAIAGFLLDAELFKRLNSPDIVVTRGHQGTTPFQHTKKVLESMSAEGAGLQPDQVAIIRLAGYLHDLGKALSAGIPHEEANQMKDLWGSKHSYPDHHLVSLLILDRLQQQPGVSQLITEMGEDVWQKLLLVVRNHHIFEINSTDEEKLKLMENKLSQLIDDDVQYEAFLLTFVFSYADIRSNERYKAMWPDKIEAIEKLFSRVVEGMNNNLYALRNQILSSLG